MKKLLVLFVSLFALSSFAAEVIVFKTTKGNFEVEMNDQLAPLTVANFISYVDSGFYDQTIFHRVIKGFVIQGGGHTQDMTRKPTQAPIKNEAKNGLSNLRGTISMARTADIDSATSQFFINTVDNVRLDHQDDSKYGYAVFGKVISGMDVVDQIEAVATHDVDGFGNVPVDPIVVIKAYRK